MVAWPSEARKRDGPPSTLAELGERYVLEHGRASLGPDFMQGLLEREQQIGQVEIAGAMAVYSSLGGRLRGRRVIHWIDNTSACAALAKGYAGAPDSRKLVHATHAVLAALEVSVFFEYVRTDANVADAPSRQPELEAARYWILKRVVVRWRGRCFAKGGRLVSRPIACLMPERELWYDETRVWEARPWILTARNW